MNTHLQPKSRRRLVSSLSAALLFATTLTATATAPAAEAPAAPAPAATAAAAPVATPAAPAAHVAVGAEVPYADLATYLGARLKVTSSLGTVREGVLTGWSSIAINLQLGPEMRDIVLSMPSENVRKVELVADAAPKP